MSETAPGKLENLMGQGRGLSLEKPGKLPSKFTADAGQTLPGSAEVALGRVLAFHRGQGGLELLDEAVALAARIHLWSTEMLNPKVVGQMSTPGPSSA